MATLAVLVATRKDAFVLGQHATQLEARRAHMRVFLDSGELRELDTPLSGSATLHIVQALSGG